MRELQKPYQGNSVFPWMFLKVNIKSQPLCICVLWMYVCVHITYIFIHHGSLCIGEDFRGCCCQFTRGNAKGLKTDKIRCHRTCRLQPLEFRLAIIALELINWITLRNLENSHVNQLFGIWYLIFPRHASIYICNKYIWPVKKVNDSRIGW